MERRLEGENRNGLRVLVSVCGPSAAWSGDDRNKAGDRRKPFREGAILMFMVSEVGCGVELVG
ncbi:MAG: hypothetical protein D6741_01485 [Planctomycetota bacterium]|nr:MAG: hypothetical protein D6741_01485 [Planctomycetota bacterium]